MPALKMTPLQDIRPEPVLTDIIALYLKMLIKQQGYSKATVALYGHWLRQFAAWRETGSSGLRGLPIGCAVPLSDFCPAHLREFRNHKVTTHEYKARTVNSLVAALKSFGKWLAEEDYCERDPAERLTGAKIDEPTRHLLHEGDDLRLLEACKRFPKKPRRALACAVMSVLVHGGLRRNELLALTRQDFAPVSKPKPGEPVQYQLTVHKGKGGKSRNVPICEEAARYLQAWLEQRPPDCRPPAVATDALFMHNRTQPLAVHGLEVIITDACHLAGITYHVTPHSFRHAYATRLINKTHDIKAVSQLLGHANTSMTMNVYCHTDADRMRAVANQSSPMRASMEKPAPVGGTQNSARAKATNVGRPDSAERAAPRLAAWRKPPPAPKRQMVPKKRRFPRIPLRQHDIKAAKPSA